MTLVGFVFNFAPYAAKRLSLYGMKPEDALRRALSTAPPPKLGKKQPKKG